MKDVYVIYLFFTLALHYINQTLFLHQRASQTNEIHDVCYLLQMIASKNRPGSQSFMPKCVLAMRARHGLLLYKFLILSVVFLMMHACLFIKEYLLVFFCVCVQDTRTMLATAFS